MNLVVRFDTAGVHLRPGESIIVGRGEASGLRINDPRVSRTHLRITNEAGVCLLADLQSTHGTFLHDTALLAEQREPPPVRVQLGSAEGPTVEVSAAPADTQTAEPTSIDLAQTGSSAVIGRDPGCDLPLADLLVSRRHAEVTRTGDGVMARDLGSRNGTFINGERLSAATLLAPDDVLSIGHHTFRLRGSTLRVVGDDVQIGFAADQLSFALPDGKVLLNEVSFALEPGTLMGVVGGSGAGKTTLLDALTGHQPATSGRVIYDGRDFYQHLASLRHRVGVVPQDDVVHPQLSTRAALEFAARLRFPDDIDPADRHTRVGEVLAELGLTDHADTRVSALSGGQRKRVSVALELLTQPSLIFLDEPTSGLDVDLVKQVMATLRTLADAGRTVVVITHATEGLELCDKLLALAPGGHVAYLGPPGQVLEFFGVDDFPAAIEQTKRDPEGVARRYRESAVHDEQLGTPLRAARLHRTSEAPEPIRQQSLGFQVGTLLRRQLRVLLADRVQASLLLAMPVILAALALVVPGSQGLGSPAPDEHASAQPMQLLVVLTLGAVFMGIAGSIRDLVSERAVYVREYAVGLSPTAYLTSKIIAHGVLVFAQVSVMVLLILAFRPGPDSAVLLGSPALELILSLGLCALACVCIGLALSAMVRTSEQTMPVIVLLVMTQLVFSAGLFPVAGRIGLEQISWLFPSRWGYAATAAVTDVNRVVPSASDGLWTHDAGIWLSSLTILLVIGLAWAALAQWRLGRPYRARG